jgi:GTP cyclohydrolase II
MHQVERAIFDLRRGLPVLIESAPGDADFGTLVYPLESIDDSAIVALAGQAPKEVCLTLTGHRMEALGYPPSSAPACLALNRPDHFDPEQLYRIALSSPPTDDKLFDDPRPAGRNDLAALALMRRALLIPAALTINIHAEYRPPLDDLIRRGELLSLPASEGEQCLSTAGDMLKRVSEAEVPLAESARSKFILFREPDGLREHVAVLIGTPEQWPENVPIRLHSACLTGDLFASLRCDCGEQLRTAVAVINKLGGGVLLYLAQEGRGIGLANKLRAYNLQDQGHDTYDADQILGFSADERRFGVAVDMLNSLGIRRVRLLTNNPAKIDALVTGGIEVVEQDRLFGRVTEQNRRYLNSKASRSGHLLDDLLKS